MYQAYFSGCLSHPTTGLIKIELCVKPYYCIRHIPQDVYHTPLLDLSKFNCVSNPTIVSGIFLRMFITPHYWTYQNSTVCQTLLLYQAYFSGCLSHPTTGLIKIQLCVKPYYCIRHIPQDVYHTPLLDLSKLSCVANPTNVSGIFFRMFITPHYCVSNPTIVSGIFLRMFITPHYCVSNPTIVSGIFLRMFITPHYWMYQN